MPNPELDLATLSQSEHARKIFAYVSRNPERSWFNEIVRNVGYSKVTVGKYLRMMEEKKIMKNTLCKILVNEKYRARGKKIARLNTRLVSSYNMADTPEAKEFEKLLGRL
jgi:predicted transcriptional regulator with HTH domain